MHVLIIAGEQLNEKNQIKSIFEINQALALKQLHIKVGLIAVNLNGSFYKDLIKSMKFCDIFRFCRTTCTQQSIAGVNLIEISGRFTTPAKLGLYRNEVKNAGIKAFEYYVKKFGLPDIIHAHSRFLDSVLIAQSIYQLYSIPYVFTEHSSFHQRKMVKNKEYETYVKLVNDSQSWIVVSDSLGESILDNLNALSLKVNKSFLTIPNLLDSCFIDQTKEKRKKKNPLLFTFLTIGSLDENKNHELLINSFEKLYRELKLVELRIVGEGDLRRVLENIVSTKSLRNVTFLDKQNRAGVLDELLRANCLVLCSNVETFGVVLIEAMSVGLPVISTRSGGPNNIVNSNNGILIDVDDMEGLRIAMKTMLEKHHLYNSQLIIEESIKEYGMENVGGKLIKLYKEVLGHYDSNN